MIVAGETASSTSLVVLLLAGGLQMGLLGVHSQNWHTIKGVELAHDAGGEGC